MGYAEECPITCPEEHIVYHGMAIVETVQTNYGGFTREQVMRAAEARDAMAMKGHPTEEKFKQHVTVQQQPDRVRPEYVPIPRALNERVKDVTVAVDVVFVNGLLLFMTLSRGIKLVTAEFLPSQTADQLCSALKR
eukprot:CCRYP_011401-RA/>CCRYP_011401-RA protein AED:0.49 eAED:0.45 QI:0/0/0/1/0/0.5/2/0/135